MPAQVVGASLTLETNFYKWDVNETLLINGWTGFKCAGPMSDEAFVAATSAYACIHGKQLAVCWSVKRIILVFLWLLGNCTLPYATEQQTPKTGSRVQTRSWLTEAIALNRASVWLATWCVQTSIVNCLWAAEKMGIGKKRHDSLLFHNGQKNS